MAEICPFCGTDLTDRDPDDYCCTDAALKATRKVVAELLLYMQEKLHVVSIGIDGQFYTRNSGDERLARILDEANWLIT